MLQQQSPELDSLVTLGDLDRSLEPASLSKLSLGAFFVPFQTGVNERGCLLNFGFSWLRLKETGLFYDEICQKKLSSCSLEGL